jgi:hypothetical protein
MDLCGRDQHKDAWFDCNCPGSGRRDTLTAQDVFYEGRYTKHTLTITTPPSIVDFSVKNNRYSLRNFGASGVLTLGTMSASESITVLDVPVPNTNIEVCSETVTLESTPQAVDSLPGGPPPTLPPPNE